MADTQAKARPATSTGPQARGSRMVMYLVIAAVAMAAVTIGALLFTQRAGGGLALWYTNFAGTELKEGVPDSPLRVLARIPNTNDSVNPVVSLAMELLDESGQPAKYGTSQETTLAFKPAIEPDYWEHIGSLPTAPGTYRARLSIQKGSLQAQREPLDLPQALVTVKPDSGPPLLSGFVITRDTNLWIASSDLSRQRRLTFFAPRGESGADPAWSPDGKTIAFTYLSKSESESLPRTGIWAINPDGSDLRELVAPGPDETLFEPAWSPDGKSIYFSVDRLSDEPLASGLSKADFDKFRRIDSVDLATGARTQKALGAQTPRSIGPDGSMVFLEDAEPANPGDVAGQQLVYARDSSSRTVLVKPNAFPQVSHPMLSPDGKWVVFSAPNGSVNADEGAFDFFRWLAFVPRTAFAHELPWDLFMAPASGGDYFRLTTLDEDRPSPVWLDNSTLAFLGEGGLYRLGIDVQGKPAGAPLKIGEGAYHGSITWHGP